MKRNKYWLILLVLCLMMLPLSGCVSKSKYADLQGSYGDLKQGTEMLEAQVDKLRGDVAKLSSEKEDLQSTQKELNSEQETLTGQYATLLAEKEVIQAELDKIKATSAAALLEELEQIKKVYPLRDFSSIDELVSWLQANDVSEEPVADIAERLYGKAIRLQKDALNDGYIISASFYYDDQVKGFFIFNIAIINGVIWRWTPEMDEPEPYEPLIPLE